MAWLSGYTYRKLKPVNATAAGAQTLYQVKLLVGESSGAVGEEIDCESHCLDFPNDIRFTDTDGITKHDYWIESVTGVTPNRLATVQIEVANIPVEGSVDLYMYYGKDLDTGESNGNNTFSIFDDFSSEEESMGYLAVGSTGVWTSERNIAIQGNYAYVCVENALRVIDITDKANPAEAGSLLITGTPLEIRVSGNYAFITNGFGCSANEVKIINITTPTNPSLQGTIVDDIDLNGGHGAWLDGNYFYVCAYNGDRFTIVDVTSKTVPVIKSSLYDAARFNGIHDVIIQGNYAYVSSHWGTNEDVGTFVIVNISDKENPSIVSYIEHADLRGGAGAVINGDYFYMGAVPNSGAYNGKRLLVAIDISDINNPSIANRVEGHYMYRGFLDGTELSIATSSEGDIAKYDVSVASSPVQITEHHFADDSDDIAVSGDYVYCTQRTAIDSFHIGRWGDGQKWEQMNNYEFVGETIKIWGTGSAASHIISKEDVPSLFIMETKTKLDAKYNYYGFRWNGDDWEGVGKDLDNAAYIFPQATTTHLIKRIAGVQTIINSCAWARSYNIWEIHKISDDGTNMSFSSDDVEKCSAADNYAGSGHKISLGSRYTGNTIYHDWVFVRKYANPEPTWGVSGPETEEGGGEAIIPVLMAYFIRRRI